jgi:hypothetical protein
MMALRKVVILRSPLRGRLEGRTACVTASDVFAEMDAAAQATL